MRPSPHPKLRVGLLALCGISLAAAVVSFCLAFTVGSPSRTLRPLIPAVDSMYVPVYVSMTAAGLLLLGAVIAIVSSFHGNQGVDLACCLAFLAVVTLSVVSLGLAGSVKAGTESSLEVTLSSTLKAYGPGNSSIYEAWNEMQTVLACCGVRTNQALDGYLPTPWYQQMRQGNPYSVPKIPNTCCIKGSSPSQLADCTINLPTVPAQNKYMNSIGCFEAVMLMSDAFTNRYIIISALLLITSGAAFCLSTYQLVQLSRTAGEKQLCGDSSSSRKGSKKPIEFAYANHGADLSLSRTSLASGSTMRSAATRPHGRSPAASVYSGSGQRSPSRVTSPVASIANGRPPPTPSRTSSARISASRASVASDPPSISVAATSDSHSPAVPPSSKKAPTANSQVPVALRAEPIRSSRRTGKPLAGASNRSGSIPPTNQRATSPAANQRVTMPSKAANQRAETSPPAANQNEAPGARKQVEPPSTANHKAMTSAANQRASMPPAANQRASMPPAANQLRSTLPNGVGQQTTILTPDGKRESNF